MGEVFIEIAERCNANCKFCARKTLGSSEYLPDMTVEDVRECLEFGKRFHGGGKKDKLRLNGHGEPLLNKDLIQIVELACTMYNDVGFSTNGFALSRETADKLLETGISYITFSLTGFDYNIYNQFQGYGAKDYKLRNKVYDNIEYLIKRRNEKMHKLHIVLQYMLIEETKEDFHKYVDYWADKADEISISSLCFDGREIEGFKNYERPSQKMYRPCSTIQNSEHLLLRVDGNISPCCSDYNASLVIGNFKTQKPEDIKNSEHYRKFTQQLSQISDFDSLPEVCKQCVSITSEMPTYTCKLSIMNLFDIEKIRELRGIPLVFYGANNILMNFISKIKLYDDISQYDFLIVDGFKNNLPGLPPLLNSEEEMQKYKVRRPEPEIMSGRRIIVFPEKYFDEIKRDLETVALSCESYDFLR